MLKGHVFSLQTFTNEAFALFIDKFLNGRCGVAKGCSLSNTNNSVTIGDGYFVIRGRFLQVISGVTVSNISTNGFYSLVCEIDLSKTNTVDTLNQAEIKVVYGASNYPTLTQQDITGSGTIYQYEFARFKVESGNITNFTDRRTYVDFETLYDLVESKLSEIEQESNVLLKTGGTATGNFTFNGSITANNIHDSSGNAYVNKSRFSVLTGTLSVAAASKGNKTINYPTGFTANNSIVISTGIMVIANKGYNYDGYYVDSSDGLNNAYHRTVNLRDNGVFLQATNPNSDATTFNYKITLMRTD